MTINLQFKIVYSHENFLQILNIYYVTVLYEMDFYTYNLKLNDVNNIK